MRRGFWLSIILTVIFCAPALAYDWSTNPGDGSTENPYQISEPNHLMSIGADPNLLDKHFTLIEDIDLNPALTGNIVFDAAVIGPTSHRTPIGQSVLPFTGTFDGNHHKISNLTIHAQSSENWYLGLFGFIRYAEIRDLTIEEVSITGSETSEYVGALCGYTFSCDIINCTSNGSIETAHKSVGGLAGYMSFGNILQSNSSCDISISTLAGGAGGLVGYLNNGVINNSFATGNVIVVNLNPNINGTAGGLVGKADFGTVSNSFATGLVDASSPNFADAGGLIGYQYLSFVRNCYTDNQVNAHALEAKAVAGGITGYMDGGQMDSCYATGPVTATSQDTTFCYAQAGGLVGSQRAINYSLISNCYATGTVNASCSSTSTFSSQYTSAGGLLGYQMATGSHVENCYSTGKVNASYNKGGLLGLPPSGNVTQSYWNTDTSETTTSAAGIPLDDPNMMIQTNFVGWDFADDGTDGLNNIWRMCVDGVDYPRLSWEFAQSGDFACGDGVDIFDLQSLAEHWLMTEVTEPTTFNYACDANGNGKIDLQDYAVLGQNW